MRALITGGNGYFGRLLIAELVQRGIDCVNVDVREDSIVDPKVEFLAADVTDYGALERALSRGKVDVVFHLASQIDFAVKSQKSLYQNNVQATRAVAKLAKEYRIPKVVFTSSNSVYLGDRQGRPILEADPPKPIDEYGKSKVESERTLASYSNDFDSVSFRCPNIMDAGRLGMLSILFDFIREGRKCWVLDDGRIKHQCIYAQDVIDACIKAIDYRRSEIFNIGSENVPSFREMYQYVIDHAGTKARVVSAPMAISLPFMKLAHAVGLSPLGEYQFRMLTMDFMFDISKVKSELKWAPSLNNSEMLLKAYQYYEAHRDEIVNSNALSANRQAIRKLGVLRLLKMIS